MPYLKKEQREYFKELIDAMKHVAITEPGELTYLITELILQCMRNKTINYTFLNGVIGSLDCAKEEFRRQVLNKYEDQKINDNGGIY